MYTYGTFKIHARIGAMICNQNSIKESLDDIWNTYEKDGVENWGVSESKEYRIVKLKGIFSFYVTNNSDYEGPLGYTYYSDQNVFYYIGVKVLDIEKTDGEFYWGNVAWYYNQGVKYAYPDWEDGYVPNSK